MLKLLAICVILPAVFCAPTDERQGKQLAATGATGLNYGQTTAANENHDKKNFGLNFSSDKGSSNNYSNTGLQAGAAGGIAQGGYPYQTGYPIYPQYPQPIGYPPIGYPPIQGYYPGQVVGSGASVQVPGVSAGAVGAVNPYHRLY